MKKLNSKVLIGNPQLRFEELPHKKWEWRSFYNGWIEGRANLWMSDYLGHHEAWSDLMKYLISIMDLCESWKKDDDIM